MKDVETKQIINDIIDQNVKRAISTEQKELIKYYSGGIPFMALLLIQAFNKTSEIGIIDNVKLIGRLLKIDGQYPNEQRIAMRTLALCQPLNYNDGRGEMIKYLMNSDKFTPIINKNLDRNQIFSNVVKELTVRSLIEHDSVYINIRPQPIAIWLVGEWIKQQGTDLKNTINELSQQPDPLRKNILEALAKRLEFIQDNQVGKNLYVDLMEINEGLFTNEDMICSDFGSRFILAISTVNPVATSECLYAVLFPKKVEWLYAKLKNNARRNIVRTLEKLCFCKDSFFKSACLMARLAVAENEKWSNNAKGQFLQLFHIFLAGTECDLHTRYQVLRKLYNDGKEYYSLILSAIKGAFAYDGFSRISGAEEFGFKKLNDFIPTSSDISEYWNDLYMFLVEWMNSNESDINAIADIIVFNVRMFIKAGHTKLLFNFLEEISSRLDNRWNAMHKALIEIKDYDNLTSKDQNILLNWIQRLTPFDILGRMRGAVHELYTGDISSNIVQKEEQVVIPYVKEFIDKKAYVKEEMLALLNDNDNYTSWAFSKNLAIQLPVKAISEMNNYISKYILQQETTYYSQFLITLYSAIPVNDSIRSFINHLYKAKFYNIALSLMAVSDDPELHYLQFVISQTKDGILMNDDIHKYFQAIHPQSSNKILMIVKLLNHNETTSSNLPLQFGFISKYWYSYELYKNAYLLSLYKDILLQYPFEKIDRYNYEYTHQVIDVLKRNNEVEFAKQINKKLIDFLSTNLSHSKMGEIYSVLLTKYRNAIWKEFVEALVDVDKHSEFWFNVRYEIGSGFGFNEKSLFTGHEEQMKQLCKDYPKNGPIICASMCPIFDNKNHEIRNIQSFHPYVIWLIENYGDEQQVLDEFHSNMETYYWTGSMLPLLEAKRRCFQNLTLNPNLSNTAQKWVKNCLSYIKTNYDKAHQLEAYNNLAFKR